MKGTTKAHHIYCYALWLLWAVGMGLALVSRLVLQNENREFFFGVLDPYCRFVTIGSMIPIQPLLCVAAMVCAREEGGSAWREAGYLLISAVLLLTFMGVFVWATGGV